MRQDLLQKWKMLGPELVREYPQLRDFYESAVLPELKKIEARK